MNLMRLSATRVILETQNPVAFRIERTGPQPLKQKPRRTVKMKNIHSTNNMLTTLILTAGVALVSLLAPPSFGAIILDMATVGNAGNAADTDYGPGAFGSVSYAYQIGKYEVTNTQYAAFLNAVADADPNGVYSASMGSDVNGGITRSGVSGFYNYTVKTGQGNQPVVFVTFLDSMRFVNWLQNGQPNGAQGAGTTEAGVYTVASGLTETRASGANYWLPNENEWYKAAYYQPTGSGGPSDSYWLYPMKTDAAPYSDQAPGTGSPDASKAGNFKFDDGTANGYNDGYAVNGSPSYPSSTGLTDVGAYTAASSYYGTFDQGGGVWEWTEAVLNSGTYRGLSGSSWYSNGVGNLAASHYGGYLPTYDGDPSIGFRVAGAVPVPEPSVAGLILFGGAFLTWRRRARR